VNDDTMDARVEAATIAAEKLWSRARTPSGNEIIRAAITASDAVAQAPQQPVAQTTSFDDVFLGDGNSRHVTPGASSPHEEDAQDDDDRLRDLGARVSEAWKRDSRREEDVQRLAGADQGGDIYVPGEFRCPKCGFFLSQFRLRAADGAIGDRDEPGEHCPNDGSPLWRVTWKQRAEEHFERAVEEMKRANEAVAALPQAIAAARREALEEAAKIADPPLAHRKGPVGLWRKRRAEIAAAIRSLIQSQPLQEGK
jgi:hypothetical protein